MTHQQFYWKHPESGSYIHTQVSCWDSWLLRCLQIYYALESVWMQMQWKCYARYVPRQATKTAQIPHERISSEIRNSAISEDSEKQPQQQHEQQNTKNKSYNQADSFGKSRFGQDGETSDFVGLIRRAHSAPIQPNCAAIRCTVCVYHTRFIWKTYSYFIALLAGCFSCAQSDSLHEHFVNMG